MGKKYGMVQAREDRARNNSPMGHINEDAEISLNYYYRLSDNSQTYSSFPPTE